MSSAPKAEVLFNILTSVGDISAVNVTGSFNGGDFVQIVATFDPSLAVTPLPSITLDPSGSVVSLIEQKMTLSSDTVYYYNYLVPTSGDGYQNITFTEGQNLSGELIQTAFGGVSGSRSFFVSDNNTPFLNTIAITSDNSYSPFYAMLGDVVTLNFNASEPLNIDTDPSVNFSVGGASVAGSITTTKVGLTNWRSSFTLESGDADGDVSFNIEYNDSANNVGVFAYDNDVSNLINGAVVYDNTSPIGTLSLTNTTYNAWPGPFKNGDVVRLGVTFNELMNTDILPQIRLSSSVSGEIYVAPQDLVKDNTLSTGTQDVYYYDYTTSSAIHDTIKASLHSGLDRAGNSIQTDNSGFTTDVNRTFIIDNSAAVFQILAIRSDNSYDTTLVKATERVFIDMSFNEDLSALTATIGGVAASFVQDISSAGRRVYTAFRDMAASEANRDLSFSVTATDKASNVVIRGVGAPDVSFTLNGIDQAALSLDASSTNFSNVRFNKTNPYVIDLSFYSNNTYFDTLATNLNTITAEFVTTEPILDPSGLVFSVNGTSLSSDISYAEATDGSLHWRVYADVSVNDTTQGDISFNVILTDLMGNTRNITLADVSSSYTGAVELDNVAPIFQLVKMWSSNVDTSSHAKAGEILYLDLSFNENVLLGQTDASFFVSGYDMSAATITTTYLNNVSNQIQAYFTLNADHREGNVDLSVITTDRAGNIATTQSLAGTTLLNVNFDRTAPIISIQDFGKLAGTAQDLIYQVREENQVRLQFTSHETLRSDLSLSFKSNGVLVTNPVTLTSSGNTYTALYDASLGDTEGFITFDISATDVAGNVTSYATSESDARISTTDVSLGFNLQPRAAITYTDLSMDISASTATGPMYKNSSGIRINALFSELLNVTSGEQPRITITNTPNTDSVVNARLTQGSDARNWYYDYSVSAGNYESLITFTGGRANGDNDPVKTNPTSGASFSVVNEPKVTFSYSPYFDPFVTGSTTIRATFDKDVCNSSTGVFVTTGVHDVSAVMIRDSANVYRYTYTIPQSRSGTQTIKLFGLQDLLGNDVSDGRYFDNSFNIHNNRNFYVSGFNKDIAMTISGALETGPQALDQVDVSATAYVYINKTRLSHAFHFTTDATDISDSEPGTDVQFDISTGSFINLFNNTENSVLGDAQVAFDTTSFADIPKVSTTYKTDAAGQQFSTGTRGIKYDIVRDLAQQLFNTYHAADLFQNESDLRNNIHDIINNLVDSKTRGIAKVVEDCSRNLYDQTSRENIGSELLRQMIKTSGGSLTLVRDPSGCTTEMFSSDVSNVYYMPFENNDVIQFILNVASAPNKKELIGGTGETHRRYDIRLIASPTPTGDNFDASNNDL